MKVYVNKFIDDRKYFSLITSALNNIGMEVTHNIEDNFDDAIVLEYSDSALISDNLKLKNLQTYKFDVCDKWNLYNHLKDNDLPYIPTCFPKSIEQVQTFFNEHGPFILKPRIGGAATGFYTIHFETYDTIDKFVTDISYIPEFWDIQNSEQNTLDYLQQKTIIQKFIFDENGSHAGSRIKCESNQNYEFNYHPTRTVKRKIHNISHIVEPKNHKKLTHNYTITNNKEFKRVELVDDSFKGVPSFTNEKVPEYEVLIDKFIRTAGWNSCFVDIDGVFFNGQFCINDVSLTPQAYYAPFSIADDINYFEDHFKWQYGLSDNLNYFMAPYVYMFDYIIPGGMTKEKLTLLQTKNVRKPYPTYTNAPQVRMVIRGNTLEECVQNKIEMEQILNSFN
jgi:hypothetical protein